MKPLHLLIAIFVTCLWGFNFSVIKFGVDEINPFILTGLRFTFAAFPLCFFIKKPNTSWFYIILYGLAFGVGVWGIMALSINQGLSAGMASTVLQTSAMITTLIGIFYFKEVLSNSQLVGLMIAALGLLMMFYIDDGSVTTIGIALAITAACSLALTNFLIKKAQIKEMFAFIVYSSLFAPVPLFAIALVTEGGNFSSFSQALNSSALISAIIQAYPTTLLGYWLWNKLQTVYPLSMMSPIRLLVPVFGLLGSVIFYAEGVSNLKLMAFSCIVFGVSLPLIMSLLTRIQKQLYIKNSTRRIEPKSD
ncbi:MAG: O-acetylserine/cysteine efflux transporter [Oceanospirillaceae bacterium]|jgi:O-acetylserine/cysteine efflux transporter